jgi:hypothetical protein
MSHEWNAAVMTIGSHYAANEKGILLSTIKGAKEKKKAKQTKLKAAFQIQIENASTKNNAETGATTTNDAIVPHEKVVKTTAQGNKKPAEKTNQPKKTTTKQKPQEVAMTAAAARTHHSTRVTLRITIQVEGKETAADKALEILSDMFTLIHSRDDSTILLPWKKADMAKKAVSDTPRN